jgi:hypothetical protein
VVDDAMMMSAEQCEIVESGFAAGYPMDDVVRVKHHRWPSAPGEAAVPVAQHERHPERSGDQASEASDVEDLALRAQDGRDDLGVTGDPPQRAG